MRLLRSLKEGETVWEVPKKKMKSIIVSANDAGIKLMVRKIPNSKRYAFKVVFQKENEDKIHEDNGGESQHAG